MKNEIFIMIILIFLFGCKKEIKQKPLALNKENIIKNIKNNPVLGFYLTKNYDYSISKEIIPKIVIDSLTQIDGEPFTIGDSSEIDKISFSDVRPERYVYFRLLHFVLNQDSVCLFTYTEGGLGVHDVVEFIRFKGVFKHIRYFTLNQLNDTISLRDFLITNPQPTYLGKRKPIMKGSK